MKRFIIKLALFAAVNAAAAAVVLYAVDTRYAFQQYQTDSVILSMPKNADIGLLIMGTSRARILTRVKCNLDAFQRELGCDVFNIAIPFGGGIVPEKIYLEQFYAQGNHAKTILFFLDPFTMFSTRPNQNHRFVYYEPLRPSLLLAMAKNEIPFRRILIYIQSKFTWRWISQTPATIPCDQQTIKNQPDPEKIKKRIESLYLDGLNETHFNHYANTLREILQTAKNKNARLIIALPPTLLGPQPGSEQLIHLLNDLKTQYPIEFHDFTNAIQNTLLYSDYDHLNSNGVNQFVSQNIAPILK